MKTLFAASVAVAFLSALFFGTGPRAQDDEAEKAPAEVSESEMNLYIDVYASMHADHSLTIDQALAARNTSLEQFRDIERRIQQQQRLVDRVRQALLEKARARGTTLSSLPSRPGAARPGKTPGR